MSVQCPNCGFPNLEDVAVCISCQQELLTAARVGSSSPNFHEEEGLPSSDGDALLPPRDPRASIEMLFPTRHGEIPQVAGANPEYATTESNVTASQLDPWISAFDRPSTLGATTVYRPHVAHSKTVTRVARFSPTDLVTVAGVLILFASLVMPWAVKVPREGSEVVVTAGSFPLTFLFTGFQDSYTLPWLTAFTLLGVLGLVAVLGTVISDRPNSSVVISGAGLFSLLVSAAYLIKLATLQLEVELEGGFSHGIGLYIAIAGSILILAGATLRSNRLKSS